MSARTIVAVLVLLILAVPAGASHWTLYYEGVDATAGNTHEPDDVVVSSAAPELHGRANRIAPSGSVPGDGGLFLDARVATSAKDFDVYADLATENALSRSDLLFPGQHRISAWYGWWSDTNADRAIQDVHDTACAGSTCPGDEFIWRGAGSADTVAVIAYVTPGENTHYVTVGGRLNPSGFSAYMTDQLYGLYPLIDRTARANSEQGWSDASFTTVDGGVLTTMYTLVAAGAPRLTDTRVAYDLSDPAALLDADRYTALSPDIESLYLSAVALSLEAWVVPDIWSSTIDPTYRPYYDLALETYRDGQEFANSPRETTFRLYAPLDAKEPNNVDDDFEGRAIFGGVGDALGSYNSYPGYTSDEYHLYFDNVARLSNCVGGYAAVAGVAEVSGQNQLVCQPRMPPASPFVPFGPIDPVGRHSGDQRTSGLALSFEAHFFLWKDTNLDTHVGTVCDTGNVSEFDAERNTCKNAPQPFPHGDGEYPTPICEVARARSTTFTLTPIGGPWQNAIIVRDVPETTRVAFEQHWEVRNDAEPIVLRWPERCVTGQPAPRAHLYSRDAVIFASGELTTAIRVVASVSLDGFVDNALGINVGAERVVDVDILPASL